MNYLKITLLSIVWLLLCQPLMAERVDMRIAGAATDGKGLNTHLINSTIERLSAEGGGCLYFPSGEYLTGAIKLRSNITIELEAGAVLLFSDNFDHYLPFVEMRYEGVMMKSFSPLLYAQDAENITIKGEGTIQGQGKAWWTEFFRILVDLRDNPISKGAPLRELNKYQSMWDAANDTKSLYDNTNSDYHRTLQRRFFRPPFFQALRCRNITIVGVKFIDSPFWTINPQFCDNVTIDRVTIINPPSPNTDGINPESCRNVHISNCHISVGDDCITIKSGRDAQGRGFNAPCENVTITNCTMLAGHGGVVIGSEMSGSVRRVAISNCIFDGTDRGIRIKSTRGRGGVVEAVRIDNVVMNDIKGEAIVMDLFYSNMAPEKLSERTPHIKNIHISNMTATGVNVPLLIRGLPESPVSNITLSNINIECTGVPLLRDYTAVTADKMTINGKEFKLESLK